MNDTTDENVNFILNEIITGANSECDNKILLSVTNENEPVKENVVVEISHINNDTNRKTYHSKCQHNKEKRYCAECGGNGLCPCGKAKYNCVKCGGSAICPHKVRKRVCVECNGSSICPHKKLKYLCIECGGKGICEHGIQRQFCKECKGSSTCSHGKEKRFCAECGGDGLCPCGKVKYNCVKCGGSSICPHKVRKRVCVECNGSSICPHKKLKYLCVECGGKGICEHGIHRQYCKECKGSSICSHGKEKRFCAECGGDGLCTHGKRKRMCHECKGSGICIHDKQTRYCFECKGSSICVHNKRKSLCKECGGSQLCKSSWCHTTSTKKYNGYCLHCCIHLFPDLRVSRNYKTKEKDVVDRIKETFQNLDWVSDRKIEDGCSRRRPDLLLDMGSHIIIVEIDENRHSDYDCSCENKRIMELSQDLQHRPIVFIRFNPDEYTNQSGEKVRSCWRLNQTGVLQVMKTKQKEWEKRIATLKEQIQYWMDNPSEKTVEIIELFY
jgi:hypothetical protein